jgi:uncharacterized protein (TIGR00375 family)
MKIIADLHIHSKYARACSRDLTPANLSAWADKKGINVIGTGDFTHPQWFAELEQSLEEAQPGLYRLKNGSSNKALFMLTTEVASIYKQGDKVRRIHNLLFAPSIAAVRKLNQTLEARGINLKADGRPIMGLHCEDLVKICKDTDPEIEVIPAHVWTPHFGVFGSLSGFDSLAEAFGDQTKYIFAIETGLSSDPKMNWQVPELDNISLISNSDAHSLRKLGREANVFEISQNEVSYQTIIEIIRGRDPDKFLYTIEFFPEEGKYHLDGHRDHEFSCDPQTTQRYRGICPVCGKKLLQGVLHRIYNLGKREYGFEPDNAILYKSVIPLEEIIAETLGVGVSSKKVLEKYEAMVKQAPEFSILIDMPESEIISISSPVIAQSIMRIRDGQVNIQPGYDGVFGKIQIYSEPERQALSLRPKQTTLF